MPELEINKLKLEFEDSHFFVIEINDDFDDSTLTDEERAEIDKANEGFIANTLKPMCITHSDPCACRMMAWQQKQQRRAQLMGLKPGDAMMVGPDQEDVDAYKYGVVLRSENGKYKDVSFITRECNICHKIDMWGMSDQLIQLMAECITKQLNQTASDDEEDDDVIMEDITDEETEAPAEEAPVEETEEEVAKTPDPEEASNRG